MKAGDEVICTDASGFGMHHLSEGQQYTVEKVMGADVWLVGVEYSTKLWRFKPVATTKEQS